MPGLGGADLWTKYLVRAPLGSQEQEAQPRQCLPFWLVCSEYTSSVEFFFFKEKSLSIRWWKAYVEETLLSFKQTVHEVEAPCSWPSLCLPNGRGSLPDQQGLPPHGDAQAYLGCGSPCPLPHISPAKKPSIYRTHHTNSLFGLLKQTRSWSHGLHAGCVVL